MKKILALILALVMALSLVACGSKDDNDTPDDGEKTNTIKVGLICIGDENDQGYTYNFIRGKEAATEALAAKGINVEWVIKYNKGENDDCTNANIECAEEGCQLIINNSYGFEPFMLKVAPDYPEIEFISCTNQASAVDDLDNTHNAFANIYEGRYVAGVVAGMKLQEMIDNGDITAEQAVIGYVGAFSFAEVISGFTAYYLGAKSVCPPATMAQTKGAFHTGYNNDMTGVAPDASLIGTRIDWAPYFEYAIETVFNGGTIDQDWCKGIADGSVVMTTLNEKICAKGTAEKVAEVEKALKDGTLQVFDTSKFTVKGETVTHAFALDTDGDFTPDAEEAVFDGAFHESYFQSAPYFTLQIDGIEWLNSAYGN